MAWSSKKGLGISDISDLCDRNEMIDKLLDSDDSAFSDTDEGSDNDIGEQKKNMLHWCWLLIIKVMSVILHKWQ